MKIGYTYTDARRIETAYFALPESSRTKKGREIRSAFLSALKMCGVRFVETSAFWPRVDAFRVYAPDGNDFPTEQIAEYQRAQKGPEKMV